MSRVDGPLRSFTYAHDAIRTELDELQTMTAELNTDDTGAIAALRERFEFFTTYMGIHDDIEDAGLYPALDDHRDDAADVYEWDHEQAEQYFDEFTEQLDAIENGAENVSHADLIETMAAIRALLYAHSRKEDELLLPLLREELSVEEQAAVAGKAGEVTPDELTEETTKFMMERIDQDGREYMLGVYEDTMPAEAFEAVIGWTQSVVSEQEWEELVDRVSAIEASP